MTITRRKIEVPTVESKMLADNTGYVAVSEFDAVTVEQFEKPLMNWKPGNEANDH